MAELNENVNIDFKVNNVGSRNVDEYLRRAELNYNIDWAQLLEVEPTYDIEWAKDFEREEQKKREIKLIRKDSPNIPTREEIEKNIKRWSMHDILNDCYVFKYSYTCGDGYKIESQCSIPTKDACWPTMIDDENRARKQQTAVSELIDKVLEHYNDKHLYVKIPMNDPGEIKDWNLNLNDIKVNGIYLANIPTREEIEKKITLYHDFDLDIHIYSYIYEYVCEDGCKLLCECHMTERDAVNEVKRDRLLYKTRQALTNKVLDHYRKKNEEETRNMISTPNAINMTEKEMRDFSTALRKIKGTLEIECAYGLGFGEAKLTIPAEYLRFIKIDMPTTDFLSKKFNTDWIDGLPAIKRIDTYNDRVVKVTFIDSTFTKSVCSENDHFDLDVGITICCMKRMMGKDGNKHYNNVIRLAHKVIIENDKKKTAEVKEKAERKLKDRKEKLKKAAKKLKAKEEQIDIQTQAIIRAHDILEDERKNG